MKPVLLVIAGPNGAGKTTVTTLLRVERRELRLAGGDEEDLAGGDCAGPFDLHADAGPVVDLLGDRSVLTGSDGRRDCNHVTGDPGRGRGWLAHRYPPVVMYHSCSRLRPDTSC